MDKILEILEEIECNPGGNDLVKCAAEIREIVRPEGRREVVEWLEGKFTKVTGNLVKPYRFINEDDWQAQLKDWGIVPSDNCQPSYQHFRNILGAEK